MLKFLNALENLPEVVNKFMETIKVLFKKKIINKVIKETLKQIGQSFLSFPDQINQKEFKKLLKDIQSMNINQKIQYLKKETINVYDILGLLDHNIFYEDEYLCYFNALKTLHTPDSSFHNQVPPDGLPARFPPHRFSYQYKLHAFSTHQWAPGVPSAHHR